MAGAKGAEIHLVMFCSGWNVCGAPRWPCDQKLYSGSQIDPEDCQRVSGNESGESVRKGLQKRRLCGLSVLRRRWNQSLKHTRTAASRPREQKQCFVTYVPCYVSR